jgi:glycosyltransferase involved in cell wall biosynthesis
MNSYSPKISVAIPVYNGATYIESQLKLITEECNKREYKNFIEIVICDNNSSDGLDKIIRKYQNKIKKSNFLKIRYFINKKNLGFYENYLKVINLSRGEYVLSSVDHDIPEKGFYKDLLRTFKNYNSEHLIFLPIKNIKQYVPRIFNLNKLGYIVDRGSILSGVILKKKNISLKYMEKNLYPQNIIYINYFLKFDMIEIPLRSKIEQRNKKQLTHEKLYDRMKRGDDYAINDKLRSIEIFYLNNMIGHLEYIVAILKIYTWCLDVKWKLRLEKRFIQEKDLFNKITKNKNIIIIIFFIIFIKNLFSKRKMFFFEAFLMSAFNSLRHPK